MRQYTTVPHLVNIFDVNITAIRKQCEIITYLHNSSHLDEFLFGGNL